MEVKTKLATHVPPRITEEDRFVLTMLLEKVSRPDMVAAEIGSWLGNGSTRTIIERIKKVDGLLYCVDTWKGNQSVQWHLDLCREYNPFQTFLHNVKQAGAEDVVKPMIMKSQEASLIFKDGICDFVFIDAEHTFDAVISDINIWKSKVRPGGILCGHDCEGGLSDFDSRMIDKNLDKDFVEIQNYVFSGVHPGCVKAVELAFGKDATLWAKQDLSKYGLPGRSTIWHVVIPEEET